MKPSIYPVLSTAVHPRHCRPLPSRAYSCAGARFLNLGRIAVFTWILWLALLPSALAESVDEVVATELEKNGIPGLSLAIVEKGKVSKVKGYGFTDKNHTVAEHRAREFFPCA
jgi:CubicO group peptidase (beta-lactamase class C family)